MKINKQSPEVEFILKLCSSKLDENFSKDFINRIDWDSLLTTASRHGIAPLLYDNILSANIKDCIPGKIIDRLKKITHGIGFCNLNINETLLEIITLFNKKGIKVMLLKGVALANHYYHNISLRPMADIDLLVNEYDFHEVKDIFFHLDYKTIPGTMPLLKGDKVLEYAHYYKQVRFLNKKNVRAPLVETHFRLFNIGIPDPHERGIWERAKSVNLGYAYSLIPSCEDLIWHLCVHANQHSFDKLLTFYDISIVLKKTKGKINWDYIVDRSHKTRTATSVYFALYFTCKLLLTEIPDRVMERLKPGVIKKKAFGFFWKKQDILKLKKNRYHVMLEAPIFYIMGTDGIFYKILYIVRVLCHGAKFFLVSLTK